MPTFDIFDTIERLRKTGAPFCVATVMRTADATSAKAGAKAAVTSGGEILGHLGGACVQRAVRQAAEEAMRDGAPRVIRVKPSDKVVSVTDQDGAHLYKSGCPSGGTVDLLIEPYAHPPRVVIFGTTPIARALAAHAALAGFRVAVPEALDGAPPQANRFDGKDLSALAITETDFIVVASQGQGDLAALRAALESPAERVSMVASRRKAQVLTGKLIAAGLSEDRARVLKSPAGLDLGGVDPHEIALSVLAEIVVWRNRRTADIGHDERLA
ncbi:XdhC family protein [Halovulum sp. GXIMD14794]